MFLHNWQVIEASSSLGDDGDNKAIKKQRVVGARRVTAFIVGRRRQSRGG